MNKLNRKEAALRSESGFTLIEVMIAMAILFWGIMAINTLNVTTIRANSTMRRMSEATRLAKSKIEEFRAPRLFELEMDGDVQLNEVELRDPEICPGWPDDKANCDYYITDPALDDLDLNLSIMNDGVAGGLKSTSLSNAQVSAYADHCDDNDNSGAGDGVCDRLTANAESADDNDTGVGAVTPQHHYWRVWNIRYAYPAPKMLTVRVYVYWDDMVPKGKVRRSVSIETILAAKLYD